MLNNKATWVYNLNKLSLIEPSTLRKILFDLGFLVDELGVVPPMGWTFENQGQKTFFYDIDYNLRVISEKDKIILWR
jgi:hypothetical protein